MATSDKSVIVFTRRLNIRKCQVDKVSECNTSALPAYLPLLHITERKELALKSHRELFPGIICPLITAFRARLRVQSAFIVWRDLALAYQHVDVIRSLVIIHQNNGSVFVGKFCLVFFFIIITFFTARKAFATFQRQT